MTPLRSRLFPPATRIGARIATAAAAVGAALVVTVSLLAAAPAAQAAPSGRIIIGDSVAAMNPSALKKRGFRVDTTVSRQFSEVIGVMGRYGSGLPRNVVVHLGTNGTISLATCQQVVRTAGSGRTVFFVTVKVPRSWQNSNNATLRKCVKSFPASRARLIDWYKISHRKPQWFYSDGYHPRESTGAIAYAKLIDRAVDRFGR